MTTQGISQPERKPGVRKALPRPKSVLDPTPVVRGGQPLDDRLRPISAKRSKDIGRDVRMDPTRVSGPIRFVLEPMLWLSFVSGVVWVLVALDPGLRDPKPGVVVWENALPLAILVAAMLLISTISALMWLSSSTSATRARTSFAGLGMLASGWLFAKLHPVDSGDFLWRSWMSMLIGVLLVTICSVPWPTSEARVPRRPSLLGWAVLVVLGFAALVVSMLAWEASRLGLVGSSPGAEDGWTYLTPFLVVLAALLGAIRFVLRRPERTHAG